MGQMRFIAPRRERVPKDAVERAYVAGMEYIPWYCRCHWVDDVLVVERDVDDSGNFYIAWDVEGHGEVVLATTSLMEREQPYVLPVELARGTINRVRNQLANWQATGFQTPPALTKSLRAALDAFIQATTSQTDPPRAADAAEHAIVLGLDAVTLLGQEYVRQVLELRHRQTPRLTTLLGGNIGTKRLSDAAGNLFGATFNSAIVPILWRDVEVDEGEFQWAEIDAQLAWCRERGLKVCSGPLLQADKAALPDWLYLWEDDFDSIHSYVLRFINQVVQRYRGKIHIWQCAAGMNVGGAIDLSEQQRLRLTVDAIEAVRRADEKAPVIVTFDQPWAEYLARQDLDFSPIHFADALVRAELGIAGIGMEVNFGYSPGGTLPREVLEVNRQIDFWSSLGLPLLVLVTIPSGEVQDPRARRPGQPIAAMSTTGLSPASQHAIAEKLIPLLVAKQSVYAVFWNQLFDAEPHAFAHGGLFDAQNAPKPALDLLRRLRQEHLE